MKHLLKNDEPYNDVIKGVAKLEKIYFAIKLQTLGEELVKIEEL
ncbi:MAG: hypothetical protein U0Z74_00345 [Romboutsia timonensis]